jgi:hypothetical protein
VQIFFLVCIVDFLVCKIIFIIAEKKEEKDKHDKQRNKSNSVTVSNNHIQYNGDEQNNRLSSSTNINGETAAANSSTEETWIHELFQGTLVSTTKCLNCETVRKISSKSVGKNNIEDSELIFQNYGFLSVQLKYIIYCQ